MKKSPKLYLAGPEVFLPNAVEVAEQQRLLCHTYGFIPLHPMDNNLDFGQMDYEAATRIFRGDVSQVRDCDIIIANCNAFRGICMDDGTAVELGIGFALGKTLYGYIESLIGLSERTIRDLPTFPSPNDPNLRIDAQGYAVTPDFGTSVNLMVQVGQTDSNGRLIEGDFEACLQAIRHDLDSGKIAL